MAQIIPFHRSNGVFDADLVAILAEAYDKALIALQDKGQPQFVRGLVAKQIIRLAEKGERDADRLSALGLERLGISR